MAAFAAQVIINHLHAIFKPYFNSPTLI